MESRRTPTSASTSREPVVLIGSDARLQIALCQELRALHTPVIRADSMLDARELGDRTHRRASVLLIPQDSIRPERFEEERAALQIRIGASRLVPIAIGRRPDEARRRELREAGIHLALFGRFGRHAFRFQLNRARSNNAGRATRGDLRAPMEWRTRTYSSGREKTVRCYSLSERGGYFATPRPWVVGSEITLELPLMERDREVKGRVLYTKDSRESSRPELPGGMAVTFDAVPTRLQNAIQRNLVASRNCLEV